MQKKKFKHTEQEDKHMLVLELLGSAENKLVSQFFDMDSEKDLDFKIKVLTDLKNGVNVKDEDLIRILELYPTEDMWDF